MTKAIPGRKYRHQKGGEYVVLYVATHSDDTLMVVYERLKDGRVCTRAKDEFEGWHNAMPRFALLDY